MGDVHVHDDLSFRQLRENALVVPLGDTDAMICSLTDFRSMKVSRGRPRDLIDAAELQVVTQDLSNDRSCA
jgi:hypothetical protein